MELREQARRADAADAPIPGQRQPDRADPRGAREAVEAHGDQLARGGPKAGGKIFYYHSRASNDTLNSALLQPCSMHAPKVLATCVRFHASF